MFKALRTQFTVALAAASPTLSAVVTPFGQKRMELVGVEIENEKIRLVGGGVAELMLEMALEDPDYLQFGRFPKGLQASEIKDKRLQREQDGDCKHWALIDKGDGKTVGLIELVATDEEKGWFELGYWLVGFARGQGLATRAVVLLRDWISEEQGATRVELLIHPENEDSKRVAERAGFVGRGPVRPQGHPEVAPESYIWPDSGS